MTDIDADICGLLRTWLPGRRWFAAKGHDLTRIEVLNRRPRDQDVELLIVGVQVDGRSWQVYQVPVVWMADRDDDLEEFCIGVSSRRGWAYDALAVSPGVHALLSVVSPEPALDPAATGLEPRLQAVMPTSGWAPGTTRVLSVEQSNTSVVIGEQALMKVFRLLSAGINPDIEVHRALDSVGSPDIGHVFGWVNGGWHEPDSDRLVFGHLAMVQQFLSPSTDGWDLAREYAAQLRDFAPLAEALGLATGRMHRDLARALGSTHLTDDQRVALCNRLADRLEIAAGIVPEVAQLAPSLHERLQALAADPTPIVVQRVHGDFHLGQVLFYDDGWRILDFEGEPGGDIESRRTLDHPARDVAGMLRSFAYAARQGGRGADPEGLGHWREACERAFLAGYASSGAPDPNSEHLLMQAYLIDKAAYEAIYEKRNRPGWLDIPVSALRRIAGP